MSKRLISKNMVLGNIALIFVAVISGLSFVAQKAGMAYVGPFTFNTLRCFIGVSCLIPIIFLWNNFFHKNSKIPYNPQKLIKGGLLCGVILFLALTINQICMIFAPAGVAGFITSLYIVFVPFIGLIRGRKLHSNIKYSIVLALAGLYLLCAKGKFSFSWADVFLLVSAFFFALHIVIAGYYSRKVPVLNLAICQYFVVGMLSLPLMIFYEVPEINSIMAGYKPILFIGVVMTAVAYTLQIYGLRYTRPVTAAIILSAEAIFAALGGYVMFGEVLRGKEIFGCVLLICAIIIAQLPARKKYLEK